MKKSNLLYEALNSFPLILVSFGSASEKKKEKKHIGKNNIVKLKSFVILNWQYLPNMYPKFSVNQTKIEIFTTDYFMQINRKKTGAKVYFIILKKGKSHFKKATTFKALNYKKKSQYSKKP